MAAAATKITITNAGGSGDSVRIAGGAQSAIILPGQASYSFDVPADSVLTLSQESYEAPPVEPPVEPPAPDPTKVTITNGDPVVVMFADGVTEVDGSPGVALVENSALTRITLTEA
jgi:hypothetical protein